ncbi:MAG: AI-2E family transporter [Betaproteobacteria bacterium]|nr:AI-2E family transporter [Betaproteobacteria bacterium]
MNSAQRSPGRSGWEGRAALILGGTLAAVLIGFASPGALVVFTAAVFAVGLDGATAFACKYSRLPRVLGLIATVVILTAGVGAILWLGAVSAAAQAPALQQDLQQSIRTLQHLLRQAGLGASEPTGAEHLLAKLLTHFVTIQGTIAGTANFAADLLVILVAGLYFAIGPRWYVETLVKLFPLARRTRVREVLGAMGNALRLWLAGRLAAMLLVGVGSGVGMAILNIRLPVLLGFIAGTLTFIPYLGMVIALIPAALIALLTGPASALYVVLLYLGIHLLEGYVLTPMIQQETVDLAPGWLIVAQTFGFLLAGLFGATMATPAAIVATVAVQMLYVQDLLGDHVHILGRRKPKTMP